VSENLATAYVRIEPDTTGFKDDTDRKVKEALGDSNPKVKVGADTTDADTKLDDTKRKKDDLGRTETTVKVKADTAEADGAIAGLKDHILGLAVAAGAVEAGPVAGLAAGLGGAFASAGIAAGAFGLVAKTAISQANANQTALTTAQTTLATAEQAHASAAVLAKDLLAYESALVKLTPEQAAFEQGLASVKSQYAGFTALVTPQVFDTLTRGLTLAQPLLASLPGLIAATAPVLDQLEDRFSTLTTGPAFTQFREFIDSEGPEALSKLGDAALTFGQGATRAFEELSPVTNEVLQGTVDLSDGFDRAVQGPGFRSFVAFSAKTVPELGTALDDLGHGLGGILEGVAPLAPALLNVIDAVGQLVSANEPLIRTLADDLVPVLDFAAGDLRIFSNVLQLLGPLAGPVAIGVGSLFAAFKAYTLVTDATKALKEFIGVSAVADAVGGGGGIAGDAEGAAKSGGLLGAAKGVGSSPVGILGGRTLPELLGVGSEDGLLGLGLSTAGLAAVGGLGALTAGGIYLGIQAADSKQKAAVNAGLAQAAPIYTGVTTQAQLNAANTQASALKQTFSTANNPRYAAPGVNQDLGHDQSAGQGGTGGTSVIGTAPLAPVTAALSTAQKQAQNAVSAIALLRSATGQTIPQIVAFASEIGVNLTSGIGLATSKFITLSQATGLNASGIQLLSQAYDDFNPALGKTSNYTEGLVNEFAAYQARVTATTGASDTFTLALVTLQEQLKGQAKGLDGSSVAAAQNRVALVGGVTALQQQTEALEQAGVPLSAVNAFYTAGYEKLLALGEAQSTATTATGKYRDALKTLPAEPPAIFDAIDLAATISSNGVATLTNNLITLTSEFRSAGASAATAATAEAGVTHAAEAGRGNAVGGFVDGPFGSPQIIKAHAGELILNPNQQAAVAALGMSGGGNADLAAAMREQTAALLAALAQVGPSVGASLSGSTAQASQQGRALTGSARY
jgi:hypothetical protein